MHRGEKSPLAFEGMLDVTRLKSNFKIFKKYLTNYKICGIIYM